MITSLTCVRVAPATVPALNDDGTRRLNYAGNPFEWSVFAIIEYTATLRGDRWVWRKTKVIATGRKSVMFPKFPQHRMAPRGGLQNKPVVWTDLRAMTLPWAWVNQDIAGMIEAMDRDQTGTGPILADALQDHGFPEACPVLAILRSLP